MLIGLGVTTAGLLLLERVGSASTNVSEGAETEEGIARDASSERDDFYEEWDGDCAGDETPRWDSPAVAGSA